MSRINQFSPIVRALRDFVEHVHSKKSTGDDQSKDNEEKSSDNRNNDSDDEKKSDNQSEEGSEPTDDSSGIDFSDPKFKGSPLYAPEPDDPTKVSWSKEDVNADPFDVDIFIPTAEAAQKEGYTEQQFIDAAEVAVAYIEEAVGRWWPVDIEIRDERIPKHADKDGDYWNYISGDDTIDHDFVGLEDPPADDCSIFLAPSPGSFGDYPWCRIGSAQDLAGTEPEYQGGGPKDGDDIDAHKKIETLLHEVGHCMKLEHRDGVDVDGAPTPMNLYSSEGYHSRPGIDFVVYDYAAKCKNEVRHHFDDTWSWDGEV